VSIAVVIDRVSAAFAAEVPRARGNLRATGPSTSPQARRDRYQ
jgi:hypothetical protein